MPSDGPGFVYHRRAVLTVIATNVAVPSGAFGGEQTLPAGVLF